LKQIYFGNIFASILILLIGNGNNYLNLKLKFWF